MENAADLFRDVEIVSECDSVATCDFKDLVLAVAVESCPLDVLGVGVALVKECRVTFVRDTELATFMWMRKTDDKRLELSRSSRSVDVSLKFA